MLERRCLGKLTDMMFQAVVAEVPPELGVIAMIIGLGLAVILHEVAHGYVALLLGDPTAKYAGRLTLNPIKHIDLWGTILFPLFLFLVSGGRTMFGWAKPVPVNYYNLRNGRWGPVLVALAGPGTNLLLLILFSLLARFSLNGTALPYLFITIAQINGVLMLFNLIPIPPLDGSRILMVVLEDRPDIMRTLEQYGFFILLAIIAFGGSLLTNLVYIPALELTRFIAGF